MLKYFSYEMYGNDYIILYFDFDLCNKELKINVNDGLPVPYLLQIFIIDKLLNSNKNEFVLSLVIEEITRTEENICNLELKKAAISNNEDFVFIRPRIWYDEIYIVHKYEEDWKKLWILENKKFM